MLTISKLVHFYHDRIEDLYVSQFFIHIRKFSNKTFVGVAVAVLWGCPLLGGSLVPLFGIIGSRNFKNGRSWRFFRGMCMSM
jgi:hypothetical protein